MPALIDLRRRIKSVKNTQQITQAMKSVATAKFKKAQRAVLEARPFWHTYPDILSDAIRWARQTNHPLLMKRKEKRIEGIVISSEKGLCGAFNSNLLERALSFFEEKAEHSTIRLVVIGKKAAMFFKNQPFPIDRIYSDQISKVSEEDLTELAQYIMRLYTLSKTDAVYTVYNEFKSILAPRLTVTKFLPFEDEQTDKETDPEETLKQNPPVWEPGASSLLSNMIPLFIETQIRHFFFESAAAEQAARMMAMDNATKSAGDLIDELTLDLNKIRQASITKELLEIISAVEALAE
jgi:F-type H+-transporting ATPase subunit gamma